MLFASFATVFHQVLGHLRVGDIVKRCAAPSVKCVDLDAAADQELNDLHVVPKRSNVQRRALIIIAFVQVMA